ncbi:MAG: hypothetical protein HW390_2290 [Candidatus Brocadiaceae bacterium]|nr:hypothetical protein [Candidatus Brocadiaceae bacterium]
MAKVGQDAVFNNLHKSILSILKRREGKKNEPVVIKPVKKIQKEEQESDVAVSKIKLRSQPIRGYSDEAIKIMLKDKGFFDKNGNNAASGFPHQYEIQKDGKVVYDHASGLMWQQSGSADEMSYKKAGAYYRYLESSRLCRLSGLAITYP